jgi:hypothetical protein
MVLESLSGLNLDFFDKIVFVALQEHQDKYNFSECFYSELDKLNLLNKSKLLFLENKTSSQSETVYQAIKKAEIDGFIFIKDCDSYFSATITEEQNQVCYFDLHKIDSVNAISKSYIDFDSNKKIITKPIVQKSNTNTQRLQNNFELEKIPKNFKYLNSVTYTNKLNIQINNHILANV